MKKQGASCPDFVNAEEKPLLLRLCGAGTAEKDRKGCSADRITLGEIRELSLLLIPNPTSARLLLFKARLNSVAGVELPPGIRPEQELTSWDLWASLHQGVFLHSHYSYRKRH